MIAVFLFSIAAVSAGDVNDTVIAAEDRNDLSAGNEIAADNLKASEENTELLQADNDESMVVGNDSEVINVDMSAYLNLSGEIGSGGNIELKYGYYTYDSGSTINITVADSVIDGKGAVIDMAGSNIQAFYVSASCVTIKNLTIKNANYSGRGGAIYFSNSATSGTVTKL